MIYVMQSFSTIIPYCVYHVSILLDLLCNKDRSTFSSMKIDYFLEVFRSVKFVHSKGPNYQKGDYLK